MEQSIERWNQRHGCRQDANRRRLNRRSRAPRSKWLTLAVFGSLGIFASGPRLGLSDAILAADAPTGNWEGSAGADAATRQQAHELIRRAMVEMDARHFDAARRLAKRAAATGVGFGIFDVRPEQLLAEIDRREQNEAGAGSAPTASPAPKNAKAAAAAATVRVQKTTKNPAAIIQTSATDWPGDGGTGVQTAVAESQSTAVDRQKPAEQAHAEKARAIELVDQGLLALEERRFDDAERFAQKAASMHVAWDRYDYRPDHLVNDIATQRSLAAAPAASTAVSPAAAPAAAPAVAPAASPSVVNTSLAPASNQSTAVGWPAPPAFDLTPKDQPAPAPAPAPAPRGPLELFDLPDTRSSALQPAAQQSPASADLSLTSEPALAAASVPGAAAAPVARTVPLSAATPAPPATATARPSAAEYLLTQAMDDLRAGRQEVARQRIERALHMIPGARQIPGQQPGELSPPSSNSPRSNFPKAIQPGGAPPLTLPQTPYGAAGSSHPLGLFGQSAGETPPAAPASPSPSQIYFPQRRTPPSYLPPAPSESDVALKPMHDPYLGDEPATTAKGSVGEQSLREGTPQNAPINPVYLSRRPLPRMDDSTITKTGYESTPAPAPGQNTPSGSVAPKVQTNAASQPISPQIGWLEKNSAPIPPAGYPAQGYSGQGYAGQGPQSNASGLPSRPAAAVPERGFNPAPVSPPVQLDGQWSAGRVAYPPSSDPALANNPDQPKPGFFHRMWDAIRGE